MGRDGFIGKLRVSVPIYLSLFTGNSDGLRRNRRGSLLSTIVQDETGLRVVWILVDMLDPLRMERTGPPDQPVDCVALREQQLGQVRAVLAGDARDEGGCHIGSPC